MEDVWRDGLFLCLDIFLGVYYSCNAADLSWA